MRCMQPVASFRAPPEPPFELPDRKHVVNFKYLAEVNALAVVLAGGDIVVVNLEDHLLPGQDKVRQSSAPASDSILTDNKYLLD